jgi:GNAT superfamily N-acetyltransferase
MKSGEDGVSIRRGEPDDEDALLMLFDQAVAWLVARGQEDQWGREPWSRSPKAVARVRKIASSGGLWIAENGNEPVGALIIGDAPSYVDPVPEPELYVILVLTSRRHAGRGYGSILVAHARALAVAAGARVVRVDCWAGAPALVAWYERQGFAPAGTFELQGWPGQVLEQRLG